ncbi:MAG: site-2 protease family protein [Candidatus Pacebacteria bacterium]|nr:site-2 protease family protein [Candidatus Paceibacterota bacterium]
MIVTIQIFGFLVLIFSIVIHEFSHGWMADQLGDPTARFMGRLTLNPIPHIDPLGSVIVPLFLLLTRAGFVIGWAKPVPYNPYNLKDQKKGPALVALAGPLSNLMVAVIFGVVVRLLVAQGNTANMTIALFDLIILYNVMLAMFNLVPLPPLDGSKILEAILPQSMRGGMQFLEKNYMLFLLIFIFFGFQYIAPVMAILYYVIAGVPAGNMLTLVL